MNTAESIRAAADELEEFFSKNSIPMANDPALRRIKFMCARLADYDHYVGEKAGEIAELAGILFSARRHQKFPGGPSAIDDRIHDLLGRIRQRSNSIAYDADHS